MAREKSIAANDQPVGYCKIQAEKRELKKNKENQRKKRIRHTNLSLGIIQPQYILRWN
ncbi:hypothetical protein ACNYDF_11585 [Klebsiella aerogenes]|uniref:hypothetical protein n=1 Tax=Klebsiella aerogenes TaxID=548 RepID=UPI0015DF1551|nr:hypothetical protein [Klebsiella aerogenes]MCR1575136.1 hypothetical protein [Klebsiella aerogenes]